MQWTRTFYSRAVGKWFQLIHPARDHRINSSTFSDLSHSIIRRRTIHLRKTSLGFYSGRDDGHSCAGVKRRTPLAGTEGRSRSLNNPRHDPTTNLASVASAAQHSRCHSVRLAMIHVYNSSTIFSKCRLYQ